MNTLVFVSDFIIPVTVFAIVAFGASKKKNVYSDFLEGAVEGIETVKNILPTIIGLMVAVKVFCASGALDIIVSFFSPLTEIIGFPAQALPLAFMRLVSSSASTGLVLDIFQNYGPDSFLGRLCSVMTGCTETVFYTMSVYFMSIGIKDTKYTLSGAIASNVAGIAASFVIVRLLFPN